MNTYMYKYNCRKWWGMKNGIRNFYIDESNDEDIKDIEKLIITDIKRVIKSDECDIELLQKFNIVIKPLNMYAPMVKFPSSMDNTIK